MHVFAWPLQEVAATWALGFDLSIFNMFYNKARKFTESNAIARACYIFPLSTLMMSKTILRVVVSLAILPRQLPSASITQQ